MSESSAKSKNTDQEIVITRVFKASPERVFDAWLDPQAVTNWLFTSPTSERNSAEIDARVGGSWTITDRRNGQDYKAVGEYVEINRPNRLVFTFGMPQFSTEFALITVVIEASGDGCVLTLTHKESLSPEDYREVKAGWIKMFDTLSTALEGQTS